MFLNILSVRVFIGYKIIEYTSDIFGKKMNIFSLKKKDVLEKCILQFCVCALLGYILETVSNTVSRMFFLGRNGF